MIIVPNELKEEAVKEFQKLYKETNGIDISKEEAHELGLTLIRFIALIISGNTKDEQNKKNLL